MFDSLVFGSFMFASQNDMNGIFRKNTNVTLALLGQRCLLLTELLLLVSMFETGPSPWPGSTRSPPCLTSPPGPSWTSPSARQLSSSPSSSQRTPVSPSLSNRAEIYLFRKVSIEEKYLRRDLSDCDCDSTTSFLTFTNFVSGRPTFNRKLSIY